MDKINVVHHILNHCSKEPKNTVGEYFAPSNIALCKYWGKRSTELNLPQTASLSVSLGNLGAKTLIGLHNGTDIFYVNGKPVEKGTTFFKNLNQFLDLFRTHKSIYYRVETESNIPIGAGLASSACGFAAVVGALDQLYGWALPMHQLSILGRLGSGSASRSFWQGFVEWQAGTDPDGMDSFGVALKQSWPEFRVGLLILNAGQKHLSSREAMQNTVLTSPFYSAWPKKHEIDLKRLKEAIERHDFLALGETAESNALAMHALMLSTTPPILYSEPKTLTAMQTIWQHRQQGLPVYFTQDAGPNLKLLFQEKDTDQLTNIFPDLKVVAPFEKGALE